jgi:Xaa-Pro aminopeptidase
MPVHPRIARLRSLLAERKADGILVSTLVNVRYLSGFTGSNALLWVDAKSARLFTDPRYTFQARQQTAGKGIAVQIVKGPLVHALTKLAGKRIAFENQRVSFGLANALKKLGKLVSLDNAIERLRMVKDDAEIAEIRASVALNAKALKRALARFRPGMLESELAARIDFEQRMLGAEGTAFGTIVASGAHSALPHAHPRPVAIEAGDFLLIDMGACLNGYMSDMTRTFGVGKISQKHLDIYAAVLEAQLAAIAAVRPGIRAEELHSITFNTLRKSKLSKYFIHSTGHGLGLEIHEAPRLGLGDSTLLEPGMAITIEPGVYLEGFGGVRIEDTVLVTPNGGEVLTPLTIAPKEWTIVS